MTGRADGQRADPPQRTLVRLFASVTVRERLANSAAGEPTQLEVEPKLTNIEIGKILLVPKLSDTWCRNSRTKPLVATPADRNLVTFRSRSALAQSSDFGR
jgi:hypothetical protein